MAVVTGKTIVKNSSGLPVLGSRLYSQMILPPTGGGVYSNIIRELISGNGGLVEFTNLQTGAYYNFWRGKSDRLQIRIPNDAVSPYLLPPILGNDVVNVCAGEVQYTVTPTDDEGGEIAVNAEYEDKIKATFITLNNLGIATANITLNYQMVLPPPLSGVTFDNSVRSLVSNGSGQIIIRNLEPDGVYYFWTNESDGFYYRIPNNLVNVCA